MMVYMMFYYGILFLILGIAVFLFIMAGSRKIRNKKSFIRIDRFRDKYTCKPNGTFYRGWQQILHIVLHLIFGKDFSLFKEYLFSYYL